MPKKPLKLTPSGEAELRAAWRQLQHALTQTVAEPASPLTEPTPEGKPRQYWIDLMSKPLKPEDL